MLGSDQHGTGRSRERTDIRCYAPNKSLETIQPRPISFPLIFLSQERETKNGGGERKSTLNLLAKQIKIWEMAEVGKCKINPQSWLALAVNADSLLL